MRRAADACVKMEWENGLLAQTSLSVSASPFHPDGTRFRPRQSDRFDVLLTCVASWGVLPKISAMR